MWRFVGASLRDGEAYEPTHTTLLSLAALTHVATPDAKHISNNSRLTLLRNDTAVAACTHARPVASLNQMLLQPGDRLTCKGDDRLAVHITGRALVDASTRARQLRRQPRRAQQPQPQPPPTPTTPKPAGSARTRRLTFSSQVLVAEYVPKRCGISPLRGTVPLDELDKRKRHRDETDMELPLYPHVSPAAKRQPAQPQPSDKQPLAPASVQSPIHSPRKKGAAAAAASSSRAAATAPVNKVARLAVLLAAETSGGGYDGEDGFMRANGDAGALSNGAHAGGSTSDPHLEPYLGLATRMLVLRQCVLTRKCLGAAEATEKLDALVHLLKGGAALGSSSARDFLAQLERSIGDMQDEITPLLSDDKALPLRATVALLCAVDSAYAKLVYHTLAQSDAPVPPLSPTVRRIDATKLLETELLDLAGATRWSQEAAWGRPPSERLRAFARQHLDACTPVSPFGAELCLWLERAAGEQLRLLQPEPSSSDPTLYALWKSRWTEALELIGPKREALRRAYERVALELPATPSSDDEPPAPPLVMQWRRQEREWTCWMYAFAVPSPAAIDAIAQLGRPVVEMGAGVGFWARLLADRGIDVAAYDCTPTGNGGAENEFHGRCPPFCAVQRGEPAVLAQIRFARHALLLCYPPKGSPMASNSLAAFSGNTLVHIGEWAGDTGDAAFERQLADGWKLTRRLPLPCWGDTTEDLTIWKRRGNALEPRPTLHPVLACHHCGVAGALRPPPPDALDRPGSLRRCRFCRLACFCSAKCARAGAKAHALYHVAKLIHVDVEALDFEGASYHTVCGSVLKRDSSAA